MFRTNKEHYKIFRIIPEASVASVVMDWTCTTDFGSGLSTNICGLNSFLEEHILFRQTTHESEHVHTVFNLIGARGACKRKFVLYH